MGTRREAGVRDLATDRIGLALEEAERSSALDPGVAEAYAARAQVRFYDRDWASAERDFRRAIELNPNGATARQWYSEFLACMGRFHDAFAEIERARELDPLSLAVMTQAGNVLFYARRFDEAERRYREALDLDPDFQVARFKLMELLQSQGRFDEAVNVLRQIEEVWAAADHLREALETSGPRGYLESMRRFGAEEGWDAFFHAAVLAALGRKDEAFAELERGIGEGDWYLIRAAVSAHMDPLRDDPRFPALLRKLKLDHVQPATLPAEAEGG